MIQKTIYPFRVKYINIERIVQIKLKLLNLMFYDLTDLPHSPDFPYTSSHNKKSIGLSRLLHLSFINSFQDRTLAYGMLVCWRFRSFFSIIEAIYNLNGGILIISSVQIYPIEGISGCCNLIIQSVFLQK